MCVCVQLNRQSNQTAANSYGEVHGGSGLTVVVQGERQRASGRKRWRNAWGNGKRWRRRNNNITDKTIYLLLAYLQLQTTSFEILLLQFSPLSSLAPFCLFLLMSHMKLSRWLVFNFAVILFLAVSRYSSSGDGGGSATSPLQSPSLSRLHNNNHAQRSKEISGINSLASLQSSLFALSLFLAPLVYLFRFE